MLYLYVIQEDFFYYTVLSKYHVSLLSLYYKYYKRCMTDKLYLYPPQSILPTFLSRILGKSSATKKSCRLIFTINVQFIIKSPVNWFLVLISLVLYGYVNKNLLPKPQYIGSQATVGRSIYCCVYDLS